MTTARARSRGLIFLFASALPLVGLADPLSELEDAAARIQYGSYTADPRSIVDALALVQRIELPQSRIGLKEYYVAYGHWKLAALYADQVARGQRTARASSVKAANACEDAAHSATRLDPRLAEAHAIQAVCSALASRAPDVLSLGGCVRHRALRTALELDASNPRIRLIEAHCRFEGEKDTAGLLGQVQSVVHAFAKASPRGAGHPDWGEADALVLLARLQLQNGSAIDARDSLERALVIAPDYREARDLLQTGGSR